MESEAGDGLKRRVSWFLDCIPTLHMCANIVDLKMLQNADFLVNIGFDTDKNEPPKVSMKWGIDPRPPLLLRSRSNFPTTQVRIDAIHGSKRQR